MELFDEILEVVRENRIDAIYCLDGSYHTWQEIKLIQEQQLEDYIANLSPCRSVAVYGGGGYFESIFNSLRNLHSKITCIIDNANTKSGDKRGIPCMNIGNWLLSAEELADTVIIASWDYHEQFKAELEAVCYKGIIVDIPGWMMERFPDFPRPIYEYRNSRLSYMQINELEVYYRQAEGVKKYNALKKIIYALCLIKDFMYAEKYIEEMEKYFSEFGDSINYRNAINKIREIIKLCAKQPGKDVLFINIVDSLADHIVDDMPWLNEQGKRGMRIKGITVQYPFTHYAINTMFTGKDSFDIETTTDNVEWGDSELLDFIRDTYSFNVVSGNKHVRQMFNMISDNKEKNYHDATLTEVLFEGLALWKQKRCENIIVMHSDKECHTSFFRTGSNSKLFFCNEMKNKLQFEQQFKNAVCYVDEELGWYDYFYNLTAMPMITMGDHGITVDEVYNYFLGAKKDCTRAMDKTLSPAFIINRSDNRRGVIDNRLISNIRIPQIIMAVLKNKIDLLENIDDDIVELQFSPGYNENFCRKFMARGIWGQYEGFIGIRTLEEIYLVSASGREIYLRPDEYGYRNLMGSAAYEEDILKCQKKFGNRRFPIAIYKMEKYKTHLELLNYYDKECYEKIISIGEM